MASVGLLLVLMMMSGFFLISTVTGETLLDKAKKGKDVFKKALENKDDIKAIGGTTVTVIKEVAALLKDAKVLAGGLSVLSAVPVVGAFFSLAMTLVTVIDKHVNDVSLLKDIKEEFDKIDLKLDEYHKEQKWDTWAAGAYHKPELKIRAAWIECNTLINSLIEAKNDEERKRHEEHFKMSYLKNEDATRELRELLKKQETTFINNLGDALAEHVKCREDEIIRYTTYILELIYYGNMMNRYYYHLNNIESDGRDKELADNGNEAMLAMSKILQHCINNGITYVEAEVRKFIDNPKSHTALAKDVWTFLSSTYNRYDWMVVAFTSKNSNKIFKSWNKHVLSGFMDVSTQRITVAITRQAKGSHNNVQDVSEAIKTCVPETVWCHKVSKTLSECEEMVGNIPVTQTYTAVHAYTGKAHQSPNANEAKPGAKASPNTDEDYDVSAAPEKETYIYTGNCKKHFDTIPGVSSGKFVVLIKSDEEMMKANSWPKLGCGGLQSQACLRGWQLTHNVPVQPSISWSV